MHIPPMAQPDDRAAINHAMELAASARARGDLKTAATYERVVRVLKGELEQMLAEDKR